MRAFFRDLDYLQALLIFGGAFAIYLLWRIHTAKNRLNLSDLIVGEDGRLSAAKLFQFGAFLVSSWGFVYLTVQGKLTEGYYGTFMAAWVFNKLMTQYFAAKAANPDAMLKVPLGPDSQVNVNVER